MNRTLVPAAALAFVLGAASAFAQAPAAPAEKPAAPAAKADKKDATVVDPICGMKLQPEKAAASATYQGKTYYFCSKGEKATFEKDPAKYVKK